MKNIIFVILTVIGFNNAFAECDSTPYNAPPELRAPCEEESAAPVAQASVSEEAAKVEAATPPEQPKTAETVVNSKNKQMALSVKKPLDQ